MLPHFEPGRFGHAALAPKAVGNGAAFDLYGMDVFSFFAEFWAFLRVRKKWWLTPIILMLVLLSALIFFAQGSAVAPFVYTLF